MASIDDNSPHDLIKKRVVVVTGFLPYDKEARSVHAKLKKVTRNKAKSKAESRNLIYQKHDIRRCKKGAKERLPYSC